MSESPKFRAGQVVKVRDGSYGLLVTPRRAKPLQFSGKGSGTLFNAEGYVYLLGAKYACYHYSELRPLSKRERDKS
jgi:hypothetical protein